MLSQKDLEYRQFVILHSSKAAHHLHLSKGNMVITSPEGEVLTRLSRQKVLALMVVGHYTITSPLMDFCHKNSIAIIVVNTRLRPVFFNSNFSEANYLLRKRQYQITHGLALHYAKHFVSSKLLTHIHQVKSIRTKTDYQKQCIERLIEYHSSIDSVSSLDVLMGIEGNAARVYFKNYFVQMDNVVWEGRKPRLKLDVINVVLDIGYTLLFNFVECIVRLFGFDVYVGLLHQLWHRRKSLVCDFVEPFRCIIDKQVVKSFRLKQFDIKHFSESKGQFRLKKQHNSQYNAILMTAIIEHKLEIFRYVRDFYRAFMKQNEKIELPLFLINKDNSQEDKD